MTIETPTFCLASASGFFLVGLLSGAWKYAWIARTEATEARAPVYVDITHRTSLLYAFACLLLGELAKVSAWSNAVNLAAAVVLVAFFTITVLGYVVHGLLRDTDNQLQVPHRLGTRVVHPGAMKAFMFALIAGEIGAFGVLVAGFAAGR
jgi:hypothetical protein